MLPRLIDRACTILQLRVVNTFTLLLVWRVVTIPAYRRVAARGGGVRDAQKCFRADESPEIAGTRQNGCSNQSGRRRIYLSR